MPRINNIGLDTDVTKDDKLLGSDSGGATKSYTLKNVSKFFKDISKDLLAKFKLLAFDFLDIIDSRACAIASKPADAFILFGAEINSSGIKKKKSGFKISLSKEYFILLI